MAKAKDGEIARLRDSVTQARNACKAFAERAERAEKRAADAEHRVDTVLLWIESLIGKLEEARDLLNEKL